MLELGRLFSLSILRLVIALPTPNPPDGKVEAGHNTQHNIKCQIDVN